MKVTQSSQRCLVLIFTWFALSVVNAAYAAPTDVWLDQQVWKQVQKPGLLTQPRDHLKLGEGTAVNHCKAYLDAKGNWGPETEERVISQYAASDYLVCDALAWVGVKQLGSVRLQRRVGQSLCNALDVASFPNSFGPSLEGQTVSLMGVKRGVAVVQNNACTLSTKARYFKLRAVLQRTDPTTHNKQLWVWITDDILEGTYRARFAQWFEWSPGDGLWKAMSKEPKP